MDNYQKNSAITQQVSLNQRLLVAQFVQQSTAKPVGTFGGKALFSIGGALFTEEEIILARERFINFVATKKQPVTE